MKGLRTILFGAALALLSVLEQLDITQVKDLIPDGYEPTVVGVIGIAVIVLRLITTTPVGKKV